MKFFAIIFIGLCSSIAILGQPQADASKVVETEMAFAKAAEVKSVKEAFLEFLANDGVIFRPGPINGKEFWKGRPESPLKLLWVPEFADISSNGALAYTTGPWEVRPKGIDDNPTAFGHFVTIWQRQPDGNYKAALDIGISHEKADLKVEWKSPQGSGKEMNEQRISAGDVALGFYEMAEDQGIIKAYKSYTADDIRLYREGKLPFVGKKAALGQFVKDKNKIQFSRRATFLSAADLAYLSNGYSVFNENKKVIESGYFLQIWKLRAGKWQIVLDLFSPVPLEKN